eukprot:tig00020554_g10944.t1
MASTFVCAAGAVAGLGRADHHAVAQEHASSPQALVRRPARAVPTCRRFFTGEALRPIRQFSSISCQRSFRVLAESAPPVSSFDVKAVPEMGEDIIGDVPSIQPPEHVARDARVHSFEQYRALCELANEDYEGFWGQMANEKITWMKPFSTVLDESKAPFYRWFDGGKLNVSAQCIDRHVANGLGDRTAILFEGENGDVRKISYSELQSEVSRVANVLKTHFGVKKGDRVVIYMPMIAEAAFTMLACARIGAVHSVVFGGFSDEALAERIADAGAKVVVTADGAYRRGSPYTLKPVCDSAVAREEAAAVVTGVLVFRRNGEAVEMKEGRDRWFHDLAPSVSDQCAPEEMDSEDPLFLLYTSGSTGKPKGVQHSQAGYILWAQMTMEWVFDLHPERGDVFWCTADVGWITGHTYSVYGPLACGGTTIMYEGVPVHPDAGRWWRMIEQHKVTQFYTAPTAIRLLNKVGADEPAKYDLSSLRILGTVGEPINPAAWKWYNEKIGAGRCAIVDTWWQTETGGHVISPLPGVTPTKPGSATLPLPGLMAEILDENGVRCQPHHKGLLCITKPWPSMIRTIWGNPERFEAGYFGVAKKEGHPVYFSGDGAIYDSEGYVWITGRVDDVINVSGHRLGTAEIEAAIQQSPLVAECAVVPRPDDIKGEAVYAFVVLRDAAKDQDDAAVFKAVNGVIRKSIGPIASADVIRPVPGLPKTRSGKIMRRILRAIAAGQPITQDTSTLEDPSVIDRILETPVAAKK